MTQIGYGKGDVIASGFDFAVPLTGFTLTMQTGTLVLNPAGTLATGTVTLPLNPPDGAVAEISSTQTITALTVNANTGDSLVGTAITTVTVLAAGAPGANGRLVLRYSLVGTTNSAGVTVNTRSWVRVQ